MQIKLSSSNIHIVNFKNYKGLLIVFFGIIYFTLLQVLYIRVIVPVYAYSGFQGDYSLQEWEYLAKLCEMLNLCRDGERYSGAKLEQWISG